MEQGRQSRWALAILSALAALSALALAVPASATANPAAVDEYDLALPEPEDPTSAPAPAPEAAPTTPTAPTYPTTPVAPTEETVPVEPAVTESAPVAPEPEPVLDRAAARRDVLFERP